MLRIGAFGSVVLLAVSSPAVAQQPVCDERTEIIRKLEQSYAETSTAIGIANNGNVLEVMTSKEDGSWTIIVTMPNGTACLIATGHSWEALAGVKKRGLEL